MSDRPYDQGGPDGPQQGSGDQPLSLSKSGDSGPEPSYGYGPPSYGSGPSYGEQPSQSYGEQPSQSYGEQPSQPYGEQSSQPYGDQQQSGYQQTNYGEPTTSYDPAGSYGTPPPAPVGGYGAYAGPASAPPKKKRTGLVIGIIAGALVVIVGLVIGLVAVLAGSGGKPSETVQAYLEALSNGNAEQALEQGEKPPDTTFATSAALKSQQDTAKISSIEVSNGYSSGNRARVSATYKFGDKQADETFSLTKIGGDWKLDDTVYPISLSGLNDVPGLTLLGIEVGDKDKVYVFPGPLAWGSSNDYLEVSERDADDFPLSPSDGSFSYSTLETTLSDAGEQAVADAVTAYIDECAKAKNLTPDNCPQREYDYEAVDGTATWTAPDDLSGLEYQTSSTVTEVYVSGELTWSVKYTAEDYDGKRTEVTADDVDGSLYGTVDLTQDPPVYSE